MSWIGIRLLLGIALLGVAILVYYMWEPAPNSELKYLKTIVIFASLGQFLVLSIRMEKRITDLLDYPYYITIGIGISIGVSLNSERLNQVNLEVATDNLNKHSDYMVELCSRIEEISESPNLEPLTSMCSSILENLPMVNLWVDMTGNPSKDFITKTEFPANTDDFQYHQGGIWFMLDLRPDFLAMAETESEQIAKNLMFSAHRFRDLLYERESMQSRILTSEREHPSEISSWYLEKWVFIVALLISLKLIKTTNSIFPGRPS